MDVRNAYSELCENRLTHIKPSSEHPRTVLLDLQSLHIDNGQDEADQNTDAHKPNPDLHVQPAAKGHVCNHESTDEAYDVKQHGKISRDSMYYDPFMANERRELHADEQACGQDASEMKHDSDLIAIKGSVIEALSWCC